MLEGVARQNGWSGEGGALHRLLLVPGRLAFLGLVLFVAALALNAVRTEGWRSEAES